MKQRYRGSKNFRTAKDFVLAHPENRTTESGCLEWGGSRPSGRYGQVWFGGKLFLTHRAVMGDDLGLIPPGMFVCHKCDNPICINTDHLYIGTPTQNAQDRARRGRSNSVRGEKHGMSRLTDELVSLIYKAEGSQSSIGKRFGVRQTTVSKIKTKLQWSHVTDKLD